MKNNILKNAFLNAFATALYIVAIASFLSYTPKIFEEVEDKTVLVPIAMLSLLVFSATLTGVLVFGRPILWYLDGRKKEGVQLLLSTLAIFLSFTITAFLALYIVF